MKRLDEIFKIHRGKSGLFGDYTPGDTAYVGNGLSNNAVVGFVSPLPKDRIFDFIGIAVSAFCEATVQVPPFVACGRAGNGLTVLEPRVSMSPAHLAYIAAFINMSVRWRFNWYRQTTADRVASLVVPDELPPSGIRFNVKSELPVASTPARPDWSLKLGSFTIGDLYILQPGDHHSLAELRVGSVPVVSCGDDNNGISAYCDATEHLYQNKLTIAYNGMNTLTAKYHPYQFAAKDDVAVCFPKNPLQLTSELFIQVMLNRERWRYSYYRKCFIDKLERVRVFLPTKAGTLDEETMLRVLVTSPYWGFLKAILNPSAQSGAA
jgi:hypothetical protein